MNQAPDRTRIESWKEIASFFGRDERTVKRWEKSRRLPVHRLPGAKSGVFAYSDELLEWLNSRPNEAASADDDHPHAEGSPGASAFDEPIPDAPGGVLREPRRDLGTMILAPTIGLLLVGFVALLWLHRPTQTSVDTVAAPLPPTRPASPASDLYLKGRYYWSHRTEGTLHQAVDAFTQAVARDPRYAPAYAGLADSYNLMPEYTGLPEARAFPNAIAAARQAVALDDSLAEAHRALAYGLFFWDWDADQAFREFRRAAQLDPTDEDVHDWFAHALFFLGRYDEAKTEMDSARQLEPTSRSVLATQGLILYWAGQRDAGIAQLKELETSEPDFSAPARYLALIDFQERNYPAYSEQLIHLASQGSDPRLTALAAAAQVGWRRNGARGMLEDLRTVELQSFRKGQSSGYDLALLCARLGRRQEADQYLQSAIEARDHHVLRVLAGDLDADMHGDPRFEQLKSLIRQRVKFPTTPAAAK